MPKTKKVYDIIPPQRGGARLIDLGLTKGKKKKKSTRKSSSKFWFFLSSIIFLIVLGSILYFYLAKAEIKIWPKTDVLNFEGTVTLDIALNESEVDLEAEEIILPGGVFEATRDEQKNFPATGQIVQEGKAKGVIRVYNNFHSSQTLVKNTRFQPPLDKVMYFRTTEKVVVPSKSYVDVGVIADQPGPDFNIEASTFSVPGLAGLPQYYSIYGKSFSPMSGGFIGEVKTVTQEDIDRAKNDLTEQLFLNLKNYLKERVPSGFVLLEETFEKEVLEASSEAKAGEAKDSFSVMVKGKAKSLLYKEDYLKQIAMNYFRANKSPSKEIQNDSLEIESNLKDFDWEKGKATIIFKASVKVYSPINKEEIKQVVGGKNASEVREFLIGRAPIEKVGVDFWPFWVGKVPKNIKRIDIKIELENSTRQD